MQADERAEEERKKALMTKMVRRFLHASLTQAFERWQVCCSYIHTCIHTYIYASEYYVCMHMNTCTLNLHGNQIWSTAQFRCVPEERAREIEMFTRKKRWGNPN